MTTTPQHELLGKRARDLIKYLVRLIPDIEWIQFFEYRPVQLLQDRCALSPRDKTIVEAALKLRDELKLPFWDGVMLTCFSATGDLSKIFEGGLFHQHSGELKSLARKEIEEGALESLLATTNPTTGVALSSEVICKSGAHAHIPLLDFHCPSTGSNLAVIQQVASILLPDGFIILESGKSFHAYGTRLYSPDQFRELLARSLFFCPIIDRAYIAHQLLEGHAGLRILPGIGGKPEPVIVYVQLGEI